jgi:cytochrome c oxidase assembly protein subunit 15
VQVESTLPERRLRARAVSLDRFLQLAVASALSLWLIVVTGAAVRLTGSGLGCDSWPGCESRSFFPANDVHGFVEFGNRVVAIVPLSLAFLTAVVAYFVPALPRWARVTAVAAAVGTFAQAPLGLITIKTDLHPLMVMSHFLLALVVLAGAVVVAVEAWHLSRGGAADPAPAWARRLGIVLLAALAALVTTGAFVTGAGPHPGDRADIRRLYTVDGTLWVHVRSTAVFGFAFLALLVHLWRRRDRWPRLLDVSYVVLFLLLVQMAVGEWQYRNGLPWGIVLVHVAIAGLLWAAAVAFVALLWRPPDRA